MGQGARFLHIAIVIVFAPGVIELTGIGVDFELVQGVGGNHVNPFFVHAKGVLDFLASGWHLVGMKLTVILIAVAEQAATGDKPEVSFPVWNHIVDIGALG